MTRTTGPTGTASRRTEAKSGAARLPFPRGGLDRLASLALALAMLAAMRRAASRT